MNDTKHRANLRYFHPFLNYFSKSNTGLCSLQSGPRRLLDVRKPVLQKNLAKTRDRIAINLTRIFKAGPDVSFNGSPTVSPMTAALCSSEPFVR